MIRLTETVKHLIIVNVLIMVVIAGLDMAYVPIPDLRVFFPTSDYFKPYQLVTNMFIHSSEGIGHLFFNMLLLFFIGPMVEDALGSKKFLIVYLTAGLFCSFFDWMVTYGMVQGGMMEMRRVLNTGHLGASGAVFGIVGAYGWLFPDRQLTLLIPPIPIKAKYLVLLLLVVGFLMDREGNVGHYAHLGGALAGIGLIYFWRKSRTI